MPTTTAQRWIGTNDRSVLLGDELDKLQEAQALWLEAYRAGPAVLSPSTLAANLKELDSQLLDLILQQQGYERIVGTGLTGGVWNLTEQDRLRAVGNARYMTFYDTQSRNAVQTWTDFGFGQRVEVVPQGNAAAEIWREFWQARRNQPLLKQRKLHRLSDEAIITGELLFTLWTNEMSGMKPATTTIRRVVSEEIVKIVTLEDDADVPLYYVQKVKSSKYNQVYYPDWEATVEEMATVELPSGAVLASDLRDNNATKVVALHAMLNEWNGRGWPQFGTAYEWFRAYKDALGDVMAKNRAVAMFVDKIVHKGGTRARDTLVAQMTSTLTQAGSAAFERNPAPTPGGTWAENEAATRSRMPLNTAAGDDRISTGLVLGQGYAGTSVPVGLVRSDFFQNRSVAEVVMEPFYEAMQRYQGWWTDVLTDVCHIVLMQSGRVPGALEMPVKVTLESPIRLDIEDVTGMFGAVTEAAMNGALDPDVARPALEKLLTLALQKFGVRTEEKVERDTSDAVETDVIEQVARALVENLEEGVIDWQAVGEWAVEELIE